VDNDQNTIQVVQQFTELYDEDHKPIFTAPKTKTSKRTIKISGELASILTKWKLKNPISPYGLMFSTKDGSPLSRKSTWKAYRSAIKRANKHLADADKITELNIHSFRHRFASLLLARNHTPTEVANLMGHSNPMITMTTYAHFIKAEAKYDPDAMFSGQAVI
jgi:integrase